MTKQEQRMVMVAILVAITIRQIFEAAFISMAPDYRQLPVIVRLLIGIGVAVVSYVGTIRWMKKRT